VTVAPLLHKPTINPMNRKQAIRRNFARRAATYDRYAQVQRHMALALVALGREAVAGANRILEVGCGTGFLTAQLRRRNRAAQVLAVDLGLRMIDLARQRLGHDPRLHWAVADGEALHPEGFDLIISNSTFQWFTDPEETLRSYLMGLTPGGWLAFAAVGPGTFRELAVSLRRAAEALHLPTRPEIPAAAFLPGDDWAQLLLRVGFIELTLKQEPLTLTFPTVREFLAALQATGATNPYPRPFSTRLLNVFMQTYKSEFGQNGSIPATYDLIWVLARRPGSS
jgi:malonyl-CoA O-methyltransferase